MRVSSRRGTVVLRAWVTQRTTVGVVFIPMHFAEAAANLLTIDALDPLAKIPEYKACAVRIVPRPKQIWKGPEQWSNGAGIDSRCGERLPIAALPHKLSRDATILGFGLVFPQRRNDAKWKQPSTVTPVVGRSEIFAPFRSKNGY